MHILAGRSFVLITLCLVFKAKYLHSSDDGIECKTKEKFYEEGYTKNKHHMIVVYLSKDTDDKGYWKLNVISGPTKKSIRIQYSSNEAPVENVRIFLRSEIEIVVAVKKEKAIILYKFEVGDSIVLKETYSHANVFSLLDLVDDRTGFFRASTMLYIYPEMDSPQVRKTECKGYKENERYCLYDRGTTAAINVAHDGREKPIMVNRCNFFFEQRKTEPYESYVSHMPRLVDYNQLLCFMNKDKNTAQFQLIDTTWSTTGRTSCEDIDLKAMKISTLPITTTTTAAPNITAMEYNGSVNYDGRRPMYITKADKTSRCLESFEFMFAALGDCLLVFLIFIIIILAQLGVRKKNHGRKRTKWYKRKPRFRRRHRRHRHGDVTEASSMYTSTDYSMASTASQVPSQYTEATTV